MKQYAKLLIPLVVMLLLLTACGGKEDEDPAEPPGLQSSSMFQEQQGATPTTQQESSPPLEDTIDLSGGESPPPSQSQQAPSVFDTIENDPTAKTDEGEGQPAATGSTATLTEREQAVSLTTSWSQSIPAINVDLFKKTNYEFLDTIKEQFPLSLRYVWGQPKVKAEGISGGYRDTWVCSSTDGSFVGQIAVTYNGTDETRAVIIQATLEVVTDTNNLVGVTTSLEQEGFTPNASGLTLTQVRTAAENTATTEEEWTTLFGGLTYEDLVISWGKADHKDEEGYSCWKCDDVYVCIMFNGEHAFMSCKLTPITTT